MGGTYGDLLLSPLDLARTSCSRLGGIVRLRGIAISLSLRDLTRHSFAPAPAGPPLGFPLLLFVLLVGRFGNLNDYRTTVEIGLVKLIDGLLDGLCVGQSDEAIARRAGAAHDDLRGKAGENTLVWDEAVQGRGRTFRSEPAQRKPSALHP